LSDKIDQNTNFSKLTSGKMASFGITLNFITQRLKSEQLFYLVRGFFEGMRGNIWNVNRKA
jgi:hypothetical protein